MSSKLDQQIAIDLLYLSVNSAVRCADNSRRQDGNCCMSEKSILQSRFDLAEVRRNIWYATPADGTTFDEIMAPGFWVHIADRLRPTDEIVVHFEDGSGRLDLQVLSSGRNWASVGLIAKSDFNAPALAHGADATFTVKWRGPHSKWAVIRTADNDVIRDKFETEENAIFYAREHPARVAA
jgi:hypothetical protein